jgi:hypothetical protein
MKKPREPRKPLRKWKLTGILFGRKVEKGPILARTLFGAEDTFREQYPDIMANIEHRNVYVVE